MVSSLNWICSRLIPPKIIAASFPFPIGNAWLQFAAGLVYQSVNGCDSAESAAAVAKMKRLQRKRGKEKRIFILKVGADGGGRSQIKGFRDPAKMCVVIA